MVHPLIVADLVEFHQDQVRQDMAGSRGTTAGGAGRLGFRERLFVRAGAALIAAGRRLQAPYEPALANQAKACRPG
jgi:hypothetical protein